MAIFVSEANGIRGLIPSFVIWRTRNTRERNERKKNIYRKIKGDNVLGGRERKSIESGATSYNFAVRIIFFFLSRKYYNCLILRFRRIFLFFFFINISDDKRATSRCISQRRPRGSY